MPEARNPAAANRIAPGVDGLLGGVAMPTSLASGSAISCCSPTSFERVIEAS